jgi:hypothetical protein
MRSYTWLIAEILGFVILVPSVTAIALLLYIAIGA